MVAPLPRPAPARNEPGWSLPVLPPRCWFCPAQNPRGTTVLNGSETSATLPCCADGEGCRDGRIFHGPQGDPHYPDQDCPICGAGKPPGTTARKARNTRRRR